MFNPQKIKADFPIFTNQPELIYLDSTATSLKPQSVLDALNGYYTEYSANVFRGVYALSEKATEEYEKVRGKVATFIHAPTADEIIFTRNASESFNLVAYSWGQDAVSRDDEIITTHLEHHSNFVPWQQLSLDKGAKFTVWPVDENGILKPNYEKITSNTKLVALTHVSNVLGTINPLCEIIKKIKRQNPDCLVMIDAAQSVPHMPVDVVDLGCDFLAFSGHKMLGPTGIGVLWGKKEILTRMKPFNYGGEMISEVYTGKTLFAEVPHKFEAGTPHIAGVIGLGAAIEYLTALGMDNVRAHEEEIVSYALGKLQALPYIHPIGPNVGAQKSGVIAFTMDRVHAHDISQVLDIDHIATRSGHHCAMPLHTFLHLAATCRASFYIYTTKNDIDIFINGLEKVNSTFGM